jgi:hypothetical protein
VSERGTPIFISSAKAVERVGMLEMDTLIKALLTIIFTVRKTCIDNFFIIFPIICLVVWLMVEKKISFIIL